MDLLDLVATAKTLGLPVETVQRYASRFVLIVPAVRAGASLLYPAEGVKLLGEIHEAVESGAELDEIEASLHEHFPVTVISPGNQAPQPASSLNGVDLTSLLSLLATLPTAAQIDELHGETAQLRALMAERDANHQIGKDIIAAELRAITDELRNEISRLRYELQGRSADSSPLVISSPATTNGHHGPDSETKTRNGRVPRRMGQPIRSQNSSN